MDKFTPGPWEIWDGRVLADRRALTVAEYTTSDVLSDAQKEANARLIASAPDLLEIAERILDRGYVSSSVEEERDDFRALETAIAKATGNSSPRSPDEL